MFNWTYSVLINENWNKRNQQKIQLKISLLLLLTCYSKIDFIIRSSANGNCISSIPLLLIGNNLLMDEPRCLTSIVLYLHSEFYGKHCFESPELSQRDSFKTWSLLDLKKAVHVTERTGIISDFLSWSLETWWWRQLTKQSFF